MNCLRDKALNNYYYQGRAARINGKPYEAPYARLTSAFAFWCAGWNDTDMTRYFVNEKTRMVRAEDSPSYTPTENWKQVSLEEWLAFRKETKKVKRK